MQAGNTYQRTQQTERIKCRSDEGNECNEAVKKTTTTSDIRNEISDNEKKIFSIADFGNQAVFGAKTFKGNTAGVKETCDEPIAKSITYAVVTNEKHTDYTDGKGSTFSDGKKTASDNLKEKTLNDAKKTASNDLKEKDLNDKKKTASNDLKEKALNDVKEITPDGGKKPAPEDVKEGSSNNGKKERNSREVTKLTAVDEKKTRVDRNIVASLDEKTATGDAKVTAPKAENKSVTANAKEIENTRKITNGNANKFVTSQKAKLNKKTKTDVNDNVTERKKHFQKSNLSRLSCDDAFGRLDSSQVIGIDLGTSKCCVAVVRNGKVEILENERGNKTTPTYVAFTDTERLVGEEAKDQVTINPTNTVYGVKRLIGKKFDDPHVKKFSESSSVQVKKSNTSNFNPVDLQVRYKQEDLLLAPEQISAMLLKKMKTIAESNLEHAVKGAVISVPVAFTCAQRQATLNAGKIAGFKALRLISDPAAVALAYAVQHQRHEDLLVIDIGGGSVNIAVVEITKKWEIIVKQAQGDTYGGTEIDDFLVEHCKSIFEEKIARFELSAKAVERLRLSCQKTKHTLSLLKETFLHVDSLHQDKDYNEKVYRELLRNSLENINLKLKFMFENIAYKTFSEVVIVGGTSRVPDIQDYIRSLFKDLNKSLNADEAVASGAAVLAAALTGENHFCNISVEDLQPYELTASFGRSSKRYNCSNEVSVHMNPKLNSREFYLFENEAMIATATYITSRTIKKCEENKVLLVQDSNGLISNTISVKQEDSFTIKYLYDLALDECLNKERKFQNDSQIEKRRVAAIVNLEQRCNEVAAQISCRITEITRLMAQKEKYEYFLITCKETSEWIDNEPNATLDEITAKQVELERICNISNERVENLQLIISKLRNYQRSTIGEATAVQLAAKESAAAVRGLKGVVVQTLAMPVTPTSATQSRVIPRASTLSCATPPTFTPPPAVSITSSPTHATSIHTPRRTTPATSTPTDTRTSTPVATGATQACATSPPATPPPGKQASPTRTIATSSTAIRADVLSASATPTDTAATASATMASRAPTCSITTPATTTNELIAPATPAGVAPAPATPAGATPAHETPSTAVPALATPAEAASVPATPTGSTPAHATPTGSTPASATPGEAGAAPAHATPAGAAPTPATTAVVQVNQEYLGLCHLNNNKCGQYPQEIEHIQPNTTTLVCIHYQKRHCVFGKSCRYLHRKLCRDFAFCRRGCRRDPCQWFHPPLDDLPYYWERAEYIKY